jgi:hypothetical protein
MACLLWVVFGTRTKSVEAADSIYYVAKNGSDSNEGSINSPWLTINHAAQMVIAGDTVDIETGTYIERVIPANSGSVGSPIIYQNYDGESVIIDGTGLSVGQSGLFEIHGGVNRHAMNYITISGLTIQNAGSSSAYTAGVFVSGSCDHITIENLTVDLTGVSGIYVQSVSEPTLTASVTNLLIDNCTIYDTNEAQSQEGISLVNVDNFQVENCTVYGNEYPGGAGIDLKVGCQNGSINNCNVFDCPGDPLIYVDARMLTSNINIYNNILHDGGTDSQGIALADELGENNMTNIDIYNNLIYNNYVGFVVQDYSPENNTYNFIFENNTLYNNSVTSNGEIFIVPNHTQLNSCIIRNNIIFSLASRAYGINYGDNANGGITVDHNLFYNSAFLWNSNNVFGTYYVAANPLLSNPTTNFDLQSGSPAIGAGSGTDAPIIDYVGAIRANPPCIGAYEYIPASPIALSITTSSLATGTVGVAYSQALTAAGGPAPYTWTIISGTLPPGLSLSSNGIISGTPSVAVGPTSVTFQGTDSSQNTATKYLSVGINPALTINKSSLMTGAAPASTSQTFTITGSTATYTLAITSGKAYRREGSRTRVNYLNKMHQEVYIGIIIIVGSFGLIYFFTIRLQRKK